jgi:hypothetical protein
MFLKRLFFKTKLLMFGIRKKFIPSMFAMLFEDRFNCLTQENLILDIYNMTPEFCVFIMKSLRQ